jgi:hypothetical protein
MLNKDSSDSVSKTLGSNQQVINAALPTMHDFGTSLNATNVPI